MILDLERAKRRYGSDAHLAPDLAHLNAGDLILVSPRADVGLHGVIQGVQSLKFKWDDARWHHAAVFAGTWTPPLPCIHCGGALCRYRIIEARIPSGVQDGCLLSRLDDHLIRARRNPHMTSAQRDRLVESAAASRESEYNYREAVFAGIPSGGAIHQWVEGFRLLRDASSQDEKQSFICSTLYVDAHDKAMPARHRLSRSAHDEIPNPAFLSHTGILQDAGLSWARL